MWDTVKDKGWRVDIRSHRVRDVIENILKDPTGFPLPDCLPEKKECEDCGLWNYTDRRDDPITSGTTTASKPPVSSTTLSPPPDDPWYAASYRP